jgi:hypothetical protein
MQPVIVTMIHADCGVSWYIFSPLEIVAGTIVPLVLNVPRKEAKARMET